MWGGAYSCHAALKISRKCSRLSTLSIPRVFTKRNQSVLPMDLQVRMFSLLAASGPNSSATCLNQCPSWDIQFRRRIFSRSLCVSESNNPFFPVMLPLFLTGYLLSANTLLGFDGVMRAHDGAHSKIVHCKSF